jgi:hypothetical protein
MNGVDLTDNGSIALVTQDNRAALVDTGTGNILFSVAGSGAGNIFYRVSGDGHVFVAGGFSFDVYAFNGTTYTRVIHFSQANFWFGGACAISRDGSTAGTFASNYVNNWLNGVVYLFDVASGNMLGSYPVSGSGMYQGHRSVLAPMMMVPSWLLLRGELSFMIGQRSWCSTVVCS